MCRTISPMLQAFSPLRASASPLPGTGLVQQMFAALEADGLGEEGTQALVKALEGLADLEVQ